MEDTCVSCRSELSALIDGQLELRMQTELQTHIDGCADCALELETLRDLEKLLNEGMTSDSMEVPELWQSISEALPSTCDLVRDDLSAFLDSELPSAAQEGVDKHLKECLPCMAAFKELNNVSKLVAKSLELPANIKVDLWPAIKARLNEDCTLIQSELSAFADQEVEILRHRTITKHLGDCQDCRYSFDSIAEVGDIVRDSYKPNLAETFDLWPAVKRQLQVVPISIKAEKQIQAEGAQTKQQFRPVRMYLASAAAVVLMVAASAGFVLNTAKFRNIDNVSSEAYLIESSMAQPAEIAEAIYDPDQ
jgi:predicted anti-sigma-YlaC factor YlaD